jgi:hypothetical protein
MLEIKKELIYKDVDNINGKPFHVYRINALQLSNYLKDVYKTLYGIEKLSDYSKDGSSPDNLESIEMYEYQNFFLLFREQYNHYVLLDGFRRLIHNKNVPDIDINVRVYFENDLSQHDILKLMLMLNHTKFFGGIGDYFQRGFALMFKILFDINILKMKNVFEGYLTNVSFKKLDTYWGERHTTESKMSNVYKRLLEPNTIKDLKILNDLFDKKQSINRDNYFGTLFYVKRFELGDKFVFNIDDFINESTTNKLFINAEVKYLKNGVDYSSVRYTEALNELMGLYDQYINRLCGGKIEKTYLEKIEDYKNIKVKLGKNKKLIKLTSDERKTRNVLSNILKLNKSNLDEPIFNPEIIILIKPNEKHEALDYGLYDNNQFIINKISFSSHLGCLRTDLKVKCNISDEVEVNSFRNFSISKKENNRFLNNDIDIYINMENNIIDKYDLLFHFPRLTPNEIFEKYNYEFK